MRCLFAVLGLNALATDCHSDFPTSLLARNRNFFSETGSNPIFYRNLATPTCWFFVFFFFLIPMFLSLNLFSVFDYLKSSRISRLFRPVTTMSWHEYTKDNAYSQIYIYIYITFRQLWSFPSKAESSPRPKITGRRHGLKSYLSRGYIDIGAAGLEISSRADDEYSV